MAFKRYEKYKDSGVEWIGDAPAGWTYEKLKYCLKVVNGYPFNSEKFDLFEGYPLIRIRDILAGSTETFYKGEFIREAQVNNGDILIGMDGDFNICIWNGGCALLNQRLCKVSGNQTLNDEYLCYILPYPLKIIHDLTYFTTVKHLSTLDIGNVKFVKPSLDEQNNIANFLDQKTSEIESLIADKEKLIQLLQEKRQAIISEAVTKGLDKNVPMKYSGVEWIGEIPEHWDVVKLKYLVSMRSGESINSDEIDDNGQFPVFGGNGLRGYTSQFTHNGTYILIGRQGALCGNINYAEGVFWASEHAVVVTPLTHLEILWLGELLRCMNLNQYSISAAQPGLSVNTIQNLLIPAPPYNEQVLISNYLKQEIDMVEDISKITVAQIKKLKEYRQSLISEAVTGKIDVRDFSPSSEEVDSIAQDTCGPN